MTETSPEVNSTPLHNPLSRLISHFQKIVSSKYPPDQRGPIELMFRSLDSVVVKDNSQLREELEKNESLETLGIKFLVPKEELTLLVATFNRQRQENGQHDQKQALEDWVVNPSLRSRLGNAKDSFLIGTKKSWYLSLLSAGLLISKVNRDFGEKVSSLPVKMQIVDDIVQNSGCPDSSHLIKEVLHKYQNPDFQISVASHPHFRTRIAHSLGLSMSVYNLPRQVLGWGAYAYMLTDQNIRQVVENNPRTYILSAISLLVAMGLLRMAVDYKVLEKIGYSPDVYETALGLATGTVDEDTKQLKPNPKWGFLGAPLDIVISSLPPYGAAFLTDVPVSVAAYTAAMAVDQGSFILSNLGFAAYKNFSKRKDANVRES